MNQFREIKLEKVFKIIGYFCLFSLILIQITNCGAPVAEEKLNVLFIAVDDMRPQLNCYGYENIKSPNIDKMAAQGLLFNKAYCQQAVCSPSRTSLLTGYRPESVGVTDLNTHFRENKPDVVTLPEHFKKNGYYTRSFGKIFHPGLDDPQSWSDSSWWSRFPDKYNYRDPEIDAELKKALDKFTLEYEKISQNMTHGEKLKARRMKPRGPSWAAPNVPDTMLADGECASEIIKTLRLVKDKPFFLAAGFRKPHLPFVAPKKYYDLYPEESIMLAQNTSLPENAPEVAGTKWGELRKYSDIPKEGQVSDDKARELTRAYYACVSYIDAQVGKLLDELDRLNLRDKTVVILWGDHGWHLLEHGLWCKHTNYEIATRVPMIISSPKMKKRGTVTEALAEFVDIYPTLSEICGLPLPDHLEGTSFKPLLDNPNQPWKTAAFSLYPRQVAGVGDVMGRTIRTDRYRYVEWTNADGSFFKTELYDHQVDPDENYSIALDSENAALVEDLSKMLHDGWRGALPKTISSD
jgi:iduronate 2-sulfatase